MKYNKKLGTVLIIDDTPDNVKILMESLKDDFKILAATDGEKGFPMALSDTHPPDIILLDILMPDIDGYEVCRQLKGNNITKDIPIIFVTAVSEVMDAAKGFKLGAVDYITKPFHPPMVKERIKTHLTLINQKKELARANATKDKLFSTIAHDMRNKFFTLLSNIELIEDYSNELDETHKANAIKSISYSTKQIYTLFENLFTWAQTQTKSMDILPLEINISKAVSQVFELYKDDARAKQVRLNASVNSKSKVFCDENMLLFILRNLVQNSIKFCCTDQEVTITEKKEETKHHIIVQDTGMGMTQEECNNIFNLGENLHKKGTKKEPGSGLGLLLVKEFTELNNGCLDIVSKENAGTKVVITLPAQAGQTILEKEL
ncbi:MAG: hybrid sensor histidine kinase/response regulator [Desulfobacteraceae bacterium]|nr:hybrid sensor histidine kinase/response regulator [Desulfobacteraceae bacterium]